MNTPLKVLGLTVFTENRLRNGRVYDVETLRTMNNRDILAIPDMGKKALKEVLEALNAYANDISQECVDETAKREHEPWVKTYCGGKPNYTTPFECPRCGHCCKEWVSLTEEDIFETYKPEMEGMPFNKQTLAFIAGFLEAKLKEKNT